MIIQIVTVNEIDEVVLSQRKGQQLLLQVVHQTILFSLMSKTKILISKKSLLAMSKILMTCSQRCRSRTETTTRGGILASGKSTRTMTRSSLCWDSLQEDDKKLLDEAALRNNNKREFCFKVIFPFAKGVSYDDRGTSSSASFRGLWACQAPTCPPGGPQTSK